MIRLDTLGTLTLCGADGSELRAVLAQPKRLALLAYLAVESERGFQRRDHLVALFWPQLGQARARQALRQSIYFLRHAAGEHVVTNRGDEEIGLAPECVQCDVCAFNALLDRNSFEPALALYRGDLLTGFFLTGASTDFDRWLHATRERLRCRAVDAACQLASMYERRGALSEAARWARHAGHLAPDDEPVLRQLVSLLDRQGDTAGALRAHAAFAKWLATEFGAVPSVETRALIAHVRSRTTVERSRV